MAAVLAPARAVDMRKEPIDELLVRVGRMLRVGFVEGTVVRKRRTVGARTDRGTWVRIERRPFAHPEDPRQEPARRAAEQLVG